MHTNASPRRLVAILSVAALLFTGAACSAEGDDAATTTTAAGEPDGGSTTTEGGDDTTTTTGSSDPTDPAALEELLPTDADMPSDYAEAPSSESSDDDDQDFHDALAEACPDAELIFEVLDQGDDNEDDEVRRTFKTDDGRSIEVRLRPAHDAEVPVDDLIDAYNSCDVIETELNGAPTQMILSAGNLDLGDDAATISVEYLVESEGQLYEITIDGFVFRRDGVSVQVNAQSGFDATDSLVPSDVDVAEQLAADLDEAIQDR